MHDSFNPNVEIVELDADRSITLERGREWPKYVLRWSIRQRRGDQDFPVASGTVSELPPKDGSLDELWERLREQALAHANAAAPVQASAAKRGLLSRLFGR